MFDQKFDSKSKQNQNDLSNNNISKKTQVKTLKNYEAFLLVRTLTTVADVNFLQGTLTTPHCKYGFNENFGPKMSFVM